MKITCPYCESLFDDALTKCPSCGAPNAGVLRRSGDQPVTIDELKQWYQSKGLPPYETTRFFIGVDYRSPRAFGIYKEQDSPNFVVYKNKDNGERAIRYRGTDEAYAVNELFQRLKQEIIQQKAAAAKRAGSAPQGNRQVTNVKKNNPKLTLIFIIAFVILSMLFAGRNSIFNCLGDNPKEGYYRYNNQTYYFIAGAAYSDWFLYDNGTWQELGTSEVPSSFSTGTEAQDFYYTPDWNSETQLTDFQNSTVYSDYLDSHSSDWDSDDGSDFSWSGGSWDSGGMDFSSDW